MNESPHCAGRNDSIKRQNYKDVGCVFASIITSSSEAITVKLQNAITHASNKAKIFRFIKQTQPF